MCSSCKFRKIRRLSDNRKIKYNLIPQPHAIFACISIMWYLTTYKGMYEYDVNKFHPTMIYTVWMGRYLASLIYTVVITALKLNLVIKLVFHRGFARGFPISSEPKSCTRANLSVDYQSDVVVFWARCCRRFLGSILSSYFGLDVVCHFVARGREYDAVNTCTADPLFLVRDCVPNS